MEFVILGALGALGYWTNNSGKKITPQKPPVVSNTRVMQNDFNNQVATHFSNPNVVIGGQTNITDNTPFFRSEKSQNTNDMVKDRRLETFTGVNNIDYTPKTERVADAPVKGLTNIYGTTFSPDMERYNGYTTNLMHNNVSPVEKQYVGPGLGIDPTQSAAGGFHQRFRVMPDNVNGYRKNTFGGEIIVGKSHIDGRDTTAEQQSDRVLEKKHLTAQELNAVGMRPVDAAHGHVHGPSIYSDGTASLSMANNRSIEGSMCLGGPLTTGQGAPGPYQQSQESTRTSERVLPQCVVGGQHRPGAAGGGYQNAQYLINEGDRETSNCHRLNVSANAFGAYQHQQSTLNTQRGSAACPEQQFGGASSASGASFPSRNGWDAPTTQKELTLSSRMGIAGSGVSQGAHIGFQNGDELRSTLRGQERTTSGPASSYVSASYQNDANSYTPNASRELATVMNHAPNVQKTVNMMFGKEHLQHTMTTQRNDQNANRIMSNGQGMGVENYTDRSQLGNVFASSDQGIANTRDFGYIPENSLRTNIMQKPSIKI